MIRMLGRLSNPVAEALFPAAAVPPAVSRAGLGLALLGLLLALLGVGVAIASGDRFLGVAFLVIGAFLLFLPFTRPSVDE